MNTVTSVPPLFIKANDIPDPHITPYLMCTAVTKATSETKLEGVQKINNVWRVYVKDKVTRLELFSRKHLTIAGKNVPLYDQNPNQSQQQMIHGQQMTPVMNDKLTIKHIPLSVSNDEIKRMLEEKGVSLRSQIKYGLIRDSDGQQTTFKSGDRFVYVKPFNPALPRNQKVGNYSCVVIHHGKEIPCVVCGVTGHKVGDLECKALPAQAIMAFKGYQHPLSNHFPCRLNVYEHEFKSLEHAYFWHMATEFGLQELATEIKGCVHAGEAKRLSKLIASDEERFRWESDNIEAMKHLLQAKYEQCEQFRTCLIENQGKTLAEATPSRLWGTGFSPFLTEHSSPSFWLGQNMLGVLLTELAQTNHDQEVTSHDTHAGTENDETNDTANNEHDESDTAKLSVSTNHVQDKAALSENPVPDDARTLTHTTNVQEHITAVHSSGQPHNSRPRHRSSPHSRASRNASSSGSHHRGSAKGKRVPLIKKPDHFSTPKQDIRRYTTTESKRKEMETTPESATEHKSQRHDAESGT